MTAPTTSEHWEPPSPDLPPSSGTRRLASVWSARGRQESERDSAMRRLYEDTHTDMVRFAAFLCGEVDAAEDIAHEAFVRVYDAWDSIEDPDRTDAYLRVTVVNVVRSRHRHDVVADRHAEPHLTVVASAEDTALGLVGRERVLAAVASLPIRQRACVVMRHWMRMTESEIAADLDVSVGSVRTHIKRGTKALEQKLGATR